MSNPRTRTHRSPQFCPIFSVWNDASQEWATATGFSSLAEAQALYECIVRACTDAPTGAYKVRVRDEYSLMMRHIPDPMDKWREVYEVYEGEA